MNTAASPGAPITGLKICLIGPATETEFDDEKLVELVRKQLPPYAPLGILTLAAILEQRGLTPRIVDLNLLYRDYLASADFRNGKADFCGFAARFFGPLDFDVFGFSTICGSYPLTLRIAEKVKQAHPNSLVVLGGPQATVVDVETLSAFPYIDYIIRGEADEIFPLFLGSISARKSPDGISGLTYRSGGKIVRTPNAPVILDLDQLPLPAFHLYHDLTGFRLCLELGRGCPFACKFCSTNDFFRRRFRLKRPETVIAQMRQVRDRYGNTSFNLVHDMFTVDRKRVVQFCNALLDCKEQFKWSCSARTDCVDNPLIDLMSKAGCQGVFFGIETGSARLQKIIQKNISLDEARERIKHCNKRKIATTASLITGFPDETSFDARDTVSFYIDMLKHDYVEPQLHLLSPLGGTPIATMYKDKLVYDDIVSDMSYQGWQQDQADKALILQHRDIFSNFYGAPAPGINRRHLKELRDFLLFGKERFNWLLVALHKVGGHIIDVFDDFRVWQATVHDADSLRKRERYFSSSEFRDEFTQFVRMKYSGERGGGLAISTILQYQQSIDGAGHLNKECVQNARTVQTANLADVDLDSKPRVANDMHVTVLSADYAAVIRLLRKGGSLDRLRKRPTVVVTRKGREGRYEIVQLSTLSAALVNLCDGLKDVRAISKELVVAREDVITEVEPEMLCLFGVNLLKGQGLLLT